ncbi:MAG: ATP-binding protein [Gammaproteobacteria bacterium]|nr:ATP-binding protein [Gammaproteobacteria bacterium]
MWLLSFGDAPKNNPKLSPDINEQLQTLFYYLLFTLPFLYTSLPLYPFMALVTLRQGRDDFARRCPPQNSEKNFPFFPFFWQSFAFPLPGIRAYLIKQARFRGVATAIQAIQSVQQRSLQTYPACWAINHLAVAPDSALSFCGHVALHTNSATVPPLALTGPIGRAVAVLWKKSKYEENQPLRLYVGKWPPKRFSLYAFKRLHFSELAAWAEEFEQIRAESLEQRLAYALAQLQTCKAHANAEIFKCLLETLRAFKQIENLAGFAELPAYLAWVADERHQNHEDSALLSAGLKILADLSKLMRDMDEYRELKGTAARRAFLAARKKRLQEWLTAFESRHALYWSSIARELTEHWLEILQKESGLAREWLRLEIHLPKNHYKTGTQSLELQVFNATGVAAREVVIQPSQSEPLEWHAPELHRKFMAGGQSATLPLGFDCAEAGEYMFAGELRATDLEGMPFTLPFSFRIYVDKPYTPPNITPYYTGEGLPNNDTFAGRKELFHWLRSLWLNPQGKPAVVLVGQRRIGKTSMLNKIQRDGDGLADTGLLPVKVDIQHCTSAYHFLNMTAKAMAQYLKTAPPVLDKAEPYADFTDFLDGLTAKLNEQRFLLMLDEADLIPERKLGELLPGFLRALMQGADYPVLLLFCGTYALKRMGREYHSILFNTAQVRALSYLSESESAEVLVRPSREIFNFDPLALKAAYRLTHGQPLQLQLLGTILIRQFNARYWAEKKPDNYVTLNDMECAAKALVEEETNMAFEQHWADADTTVRKLLSALAWATDERDRPQLDADGIEAAMRETKLEIPRADLAKCLEQQTAEEVLENPGLTYRYAVPLYRRWIAWKHTPEKLRAAGL